MKRRPGDCAGGQYRLSLPKEDAMVERDYVKEFGAIMKGIEDSVLEASDEEILSEAREAAVDVEAGAERLRSRLLEVVNRLKRERLLVARKERERALAELEKASLPTSH